MISLRAMMMRGGTSKGVYLLQSDLDETGVDPDVLLPAIMGSPDHRQIDGMGGGSSTTSKVAIVGPSTRPDCDIDYVFAQVDVEKMRVDWTPTCGNILAGVGPFAIERGLVAAAPARTEVRVHLVNTGATVVVSVPTPDGRVSYAGDCEIAGVPGRAAPIDVVFSNFCGGKTGSLLPAGHAVIDVDGIAITAIDAAVCAIIADASAFGLTGEETPQDLNGRPELLAHIESVRLRAALAMGLGDVRGRVLPKVMLVSKSDRGDVRSRYFVPNSCHPTHAVSGAICLATTATVPGSVVAELFSEPHTDGPLVIEHAAGTMSIDITRDEDGALRAAVRSTARKLFDGSVFADLDSMDRIAG
jgi:2-methylaconitate cis-trans-isomerase PrpF